MSGPTHFRDIIVQRLSRRAFLGSSAATAALAMTPAAFVAGCDSATSAGATGAAGVQPPLTFAEVPTAITETIAVPPGYRAEVIAGWGDPMKAGLGAFDPATLTKDEQQARFGYNCDFVGYMPLSDSAATGPEHFASANSTRGLLCVNHEFLNLALMRPGLRSHADAVGASTPETVGAQMAALGHSILEIRKQGASWSPVPGSPFNRRIDAFTPMAFTGPVAGHPRVRTSADPAGTTPVGTYQNCSGGITPWGTILTCEENFHQNFTGFRAYVPAEALAREERNWDLYGVGARPILPWVRLETRWNMAEEPNESNRFGWVVEIDPYDPASTPRKHSALGRFAHESATVVAKPGKPIAVYSGDDARGEFVYKFVSDKAYDGANAAANRDLLTAGTLFVARFEADGTGRWIPLVHGQNGLTPENGFRDQGDVLIEVRAAARQVGGTPMDRPEDVETNPVTDRTYIVLTKDDSRAVTNAANPRTNNRWGHIIEILPPGEDGQRDHTADSFRWEMFILAGDPADPATGARYGGQVSDTGWFACPDNICFDPAGRLWIATDGLDDFNLADGLWGCTTDGPGRAVTKHFFSCPIGAELCGPCFTPDGKTLFVAVQHPGASENSWFDQPSTRWPDFRDGMPPRPAVVAITRDDDQPIGV